MTPNRATGSARARETSQMRLMASTGWALAKVIGAHPARFVKYRTMDPKEERFVRPPRLYEIPQYVSSMKHSTSKEPYLRPTRWCDPREPEVVAMANELGAYELPDREFAEAAYWFVKKNLNFEMRTLDGAGATLRRGTGACFHFISLFIALCRAAGIKARYKTFAMNYDRFVEDAIAVNVGNSGQGGETDPGFNELYDNYQKGGIDPMMDELYDVLGYVMVEVESEVRLDGSWVVAYPAANDEVQAVRYLPIAKLGEDPIGNFYDAVPGTIQRVESLPLAMSMGMNMLFRLMPGSPERLSIWTQKVAEYGRQIIAEAGGREAYDRKARERLRTSSLKIEPRDDEALVFVD
jgi:hypothetical protein